MQVEYFENHTGEHEESLPPGPPVTPTHMYYESSKGMSYNAYFVLVSFMLSNNYS